MSGMGVFNRCCCCVDLRVGCIILAIWGILSSSCSFATSATELDVPAIKVTYAYSAIGIIACASLLFGAISYNPTATLVYLVLQLPKMILNGVAVILWFIVSGDESQITIDDKVVKIKDHEIIGIAIYVMVIFLPSIYFWLCVNSFYRKLKNDEIGPHFRA